MKEIRERAYAKLNISLDVLGTRPDGYHEMRMVMLGVSLYDNVTVTLTDGAVRSASNLCFLPEDDKNVACKAARAFFAVTGMENVGAEIKLHKIIPVCAGMGGGSSDAAAVLRALNKLTGAGLSLTQLEEIGAKVGSDVPFCVRLGTQLATGRGEIMERLPEFPDCSVVICKPDFSISTPELFSKIDGNGLKVRPDTAGICAALEQGDLQGITRRMYNVFEDVLPKKYDKIFELKNRLLDLGAMNSVMSGTGSALFGVFDNDDMAEKAKSALRGECRSCFTAKPVRYIED